MNEHLKVAICQMQSTDNISANLQQMKQLLGEALAHPDLHVAFFPENSLYMRLKEGEAVKPLNLASPEFLELIELAVRHKLWLHLGSFALEVESRLHNSTVWIDPHGAVYVGYQKIHLFDIELHGQKPMRESDVYRHGNRPRIFSIGNWKFGESICYDVRFSELYSYYAEQEVDVILVPAAFLVPTGKAHWEILLRARAIESQCYVLAAAQGGVHKNTRGDSRETYGRSMAISPWGEIMIEAQAEPKVLVCELSKAAILKVRTQIPMKNHRRLSKNELK